MSKIKFILNVFHSVFVWGSNDLSLYHTVNSDFITVYLLQKKKKHFKNSENIIIITTGSDFQLLYKHIPATFSSPLT